jgi:putative oxidoreductase
MKYGVALLRMIVGGLFFGHGMQKLTGWFEGNGLESTGKAFESMGLAPGKAHAAAAGAAEAGGGALLAAGLATPVASTLLSGTMITAIRKVHLANGPWATKGGYEYNLVLLAIVFAVTDVGPGPLSADEALGRRRAGVGWALAQLLAGAIGSSLAIELGSRAAAPASADAAQPSSTNGNSSSEPEPAPLSD